MENLNLEALDTEKINKKTENIDIASTLEIIKAMNDEDKKVPLKIEEKLKDIADAIDIVVEALNKNGRIVYLGAGNSGRLAFGDACECVPTFGVKQGEVVCVLAGGEEALITAKEGAEDDVERSILDLKKINLNENDVLIGLSASGRTPYVKAGLLYGKNKVKCRTISISCSNYSEISSCSDKAIEILTGAEVINGSTRLKAGTAQKMVLNMISTASMIKMGKVYKNYMIDVSIKNKKLEQRGIKIIIETTGVKRDIAEKLLCEAKGRVKLAVLMGLTGKEKMECEKMISQNPFIRKLV